MELRVQYSLVEMNGETQLYNIKFICYATCADDIVCNTAHDNVL